MLTFSLHSPRFGTYYSLVIERSYLKGLSSHLVFEHVIPVPFLFILQERT